MNQTPDRLAFTTQCGFIISKCALIKLVRIKIVRSGGFVSRLCIQCIEVHLHAEMVIMSRYVVDLSVLKHWKCMPLRTKALFAALDTLFDV